MTIATIEDLRNVLLGAIEDLNQDAEELERVSIMAKTAEGVMSSLKLQLQYAGMRNEQPQISFIQDAEQQGAKRLPGQQQKLIP